MRKWGTDGRWSMMVLYSSHCGELDINPLRNLQDNVNASWGGLTEEAVLPPASTFPLVQGYLQGQELSTLALSTNLASSCRLEQIPQAEECRCLWWRWTLGTRERHQQHRKQRVKPGLAASSGSTFQPKKKLAFLE